MTSILRIRCDRCDHEFGLDDASDNRSVAWMVAESGGDPLDTQIQHEWDLCRDCQGAFADWISEKKPGERNSLEPTEVK